MLQRPQARIGLHHAAVDAQLASPQQPVRVQRRQPFGPELMAEGQHHVDGFQLLHTQPVPDDGETALVGRRLLQRIAQEAPRAQAVLAPRGNRTLPGQVLKESDHQHLQIHHRVDAGPPAPRRVRISRLADRPHLAGELHPVQRGVEPPVKCRGCRRRHLIGLHPELVLPLAAFSSFKHARKDRSRTGLFGVFQQAARRVVRALGLNPLA